MRLSTHRLIIRRMIVLSSEIINTIVGPMRSGDWPMDATNCFNSNYRPSPTDYQYNLIKNLPFRDLYLQLMRVLRTVYVGGATRLDHNRDHVVTRLLPERETRLGHDRDIVLYLLFELRNLGLRSPLTN